MNVIEEDAKVFAINSNIGGDNGHPNQNVVRVKCELTGEELEALLVLERRIKGQTEFNLSTRSRWGRFHVQAQKNMPPQLQREGKAKGTLLATATLIYMGVPVYLRGVGPGGALKEMPVLEDGEDEGVDRIFRPWFTTGNDKIKGTELDAIVKNNPYMRFSKCKIHTGLEIDQSTHYVLETEKPYLTSKQIEQGVRVPSILEHEDYSFVPRTPPFGGLIELTTGRDKSPTEKPTNIIAKTMPLWLPEDVYGVVLDTTLGQHFNAVIIDPPHSEAVDGGRVVVEIMPELLRPEGFGSERGFCPNWLNRMLGGKQYVLLDFYRRTTAKDIIDGKF